METELRSAVFCVCACIMSQELVIWAFFVFGNTRLGNCCYRHGEHANMKCQRLQKAMTSLS